MLTVVTPAPSQRLTTVSAVRADLGITEAMASDDTVERWIDQASGAIVDHCRRPFAAEMVRETFRQPRAGLLLGRAPASSIASVLEGETVLAPSDYELDGGTLWRVSHGCRLRWVGPITVEYTGGYVLAGGGSVPTLPASVERAAILVIGAILTSRTRDPQMRSESIEGVRSVSWWVPDGASLPSPEAEALLASYRRIVG